MWKIEIPAEKKIYIYSILVAVGLVILFTWGQLSFFSLNDLRNPATSREEYRVNDTGSRQMDRATYLSGQGSTPKQNIISRVGNIGRAFQALRSINQLKAQLKATDDPMEQAELNVEIADLYAEELGNHAKARTYYEKAVSLSGSTAILKTATHADTQQSSSLALAFGTFIESAGYFFSNSQPYDVRSAAKQVGVSVAERMALMAGSASTPERDELKGEGSVKAARGEASEVQSYLFLEDDPFSSLNILIPKLIRSLTSDRARDFIPLIPALGVRLGISVGHAERLPQDAAIIALRKKRGLLYEALFNEIKQQRITAEQITYVMSQDKSGYYLIELKYGTGIGARHKPLALELQGSRWYLVFVEY